MKLIVHSVNVDAWESLKEYAERKFEKLGQYYEKLGFQEFEQSEVFVLNPIFEIPSLDDIGYKCLCQINF